MSIDGIRGTTRIVAVFGYPVRHSASPAMHNAAFAELGLDWAYVPFAVAPENIAAAVDGIRALGLRGVNVTVPLKELIPSLMDDLTPRARLLGAVNTIVNDAGRLRGDSTDGPGFIQALTFADGPTPAGVKAVVLGAGGSARAVVQALADAGSEWIYVANRNLERARALASDLGSVGNGDIRAISLEEEALFDPIGRADLLVNTTSIGMHPGEDEMPPVPAAALHRDLFVCDVIYNPRETRLLVLARRRGCRIQNGIEMLVRQGALAFSQWTDIVNLPIGKMRAAVENALGSQVPNR